MPEMKRSFVICPECSSMRCIRSLTDHVSMKNFCITVIQISDELGSIDDQIEKPAGIYYFSAESKIAALDDFHMSVPIGCLDDFHVEIEEIGTGRALELFKMHLECNTKRCGTVYFKLPEVQISSGSRMH